MEVEVEVIGKNALERTRENIETPVHVHQETKIFIADLKSESEHNGLENSDLKTDTNEKLSSIETKPKLQAIQNEVSIDVLASQDD